MAVDAGVVVKCSVCCHSNGNVASKEYGIVYRIIGILKFPFRLDSGETAMCSAHHSATLGLNTLL